MSDIPGHLRDAILAGRCVAFVGAGFAMPLTPSWPHLLSLISAKLGTPRTVASTASAFELEVLGQQLQDHATQQGLAWKSLVRATVNECGGNDDARATLAARVGALTSIPFKAILTTNFDESLRGSHTSAQMYWDVLRADGDDDLADDLRTPPVIKLHGDLTEGTDDRSLVFSRRDYRERIYGDGNYANFIRAVFASYTVLFIGVSFSDAYLNELRSEMLSLLHDSERDGAPWGYAIQFAPTSDMISFFGTHESVTVLPAATSEEFTRWLERLAQQTSVKGRLATLLRGRRVIWIDTNEDSNDRGRQLFEGVGAQTSYRRSSSELQPGDAQADLLITHFGFSRGAPSVAARVLDTVREWSDRPPVIVFGAPGDAAQIQANRRDCLRRGALEYATQWSELYRLVESLFGRV